MRTKRCPKCEQVLPRTAKYWHRNCRGKDGLTVWCKLCSKIVRKARYIKYHKRELKQQRSYRRTLRGKLRTVYLALNARCNNLSHPRYPQWGGRGVKNLFPSFEAFYQHVTIDLGFDTFEKIDGLVLDRENNDGDYTPGNIGFILPVESTKNRRPRCKTVKA